MSQSDILEEFQTSDEKIKGSKENQIYPNIFLEDKNVIPILLRILVVRLLPRIYSIPTKINVAISLGVTNNFMNILFLESRECDLSISIFK